MKKLGIILMIIAFLFSTFSLQPVKKVSANTGPDISLCVAEPWSWGRSNNKGDSGGNSGASGGGNQGILDPTNYSVTKHSSNNSVQTTSYQRESKNTIKRKDSFLNWRLKLLFFWQMISNK